MFLNLLEPRHPLNPDSAFPRHPRVYPGVPIPGSTYPFASPCYFRDSECSKRPRIANNDCDSSRSPLIRIRESTSETLGSLLLFSETPTPSPRQLELATKQAQRKTCAQLRVPNSRESKWARFARISMEHPIAKELELGQESLMLVTSHEG